MSVSLNENLPEGLNHRQRGGGVPSCCLIGYFFVVKCDSKSLIKRLKRRGLKLQPCLTPFEQWNVGDIVPLATTLEVAYLRCFEVFFAFCH